MPSSLLVIATMAGVALLLAPSHLASAGGSTGDVNCDGRVNSLDAALVLQREAGLVRSLRCADAADANGDGRVNSLDAALILQHEAGLVDLDRPRNCDPAYPDVCIRPPPPDLDCGDIPYRDFRVLPPDPHRFDADRDGIGCER